MGFTYSVQILNRGKLELVSSDYVGAPPPQFSEHMIADLNRARATQFLSFDITNPNMGVSPVSTVCGNTAPAVACVGLFFSLAFLLPYQR